MENTHFGLAGQSADNYDEFLGLGKKARKRRQARRARKKERRSARAERRRLKNADRRADIEAKQAQTAIMKKTMLPTAAPQSASAATPGSPGSAVTPPASQKAGLGSNTLLIAVGVLVLGGFLVMNKRKQSYEPYGPSPATQ